ncbi:Thiol-disulfide oxidoreductase ResA [compost metagenome]
MAIESLEKLSGAIIDYVVVYPKFNRLSDKLKNSPKGKAFAEKIDLAKNTAVGAKALDFESTTIDGKKLQLKEVLASGKYTLVDFWASWCGPCRKENPNIVKAYTTYHHKGLNVLSVSLDDDAGKWKAAIEKDGMPWHHVSDLKGWKEPAAVLYGIRALPQNVLLDAKGTVLAKNLLAEQLLEKLAGLMK